MPSLRDIRKRIASVKNTRQITKAFKMVSAAKLRRAQEAIVRARAYAQHMDQVLGSLATRADLSAHPLLAVRPVRKVELVLLTSDRGLCGGFNANVIRRAQKFLVEGPAAGYLKIELPPLARRAEPSPPRRKLAVRRDYPGIFERLQYSVA